MYDDEEIIKMGYERLAGNLYKKDNELYVQHAGEVKKASSITEEQLRHVTSMTAYGKELAKLKGTPVAPSKKEEKKKAEEPSAIKEKKVAVIPPVEPMRIVAPQVDVGEAITVFKKFEEFKQKLLSKDDYLYIGKDGKPTEKKSGVSEYIKKSGWRKFSTVFNLNGEILAKKREVFEDPGGLYYIWTYLVRVTAPNGRFQDAEGAVTSRDPFFTKAGKQAPEEKNIMLKAQTVAFNRAISDLIGGGAKSAEEVENPSENKK